MAKTIWAENPTLPDRPIQVTEAQFKIYRTNGWVEVDPPDLDPDAKQPAKSVAKRPSSDKKPASETMTERPPSDKKPASLLGVTSEVPVEKPAKASSDKKKKTTTKPSTTNK